MDPTKHPLERSNVLDQDEVITTLNTLTPHLWAIAIVFFGFGDLFTTYVGLTSGRAVEYGPVADVIYSRYGMSSLVVLKMGVFGCCYLIWRLVSAPYNVGVPLGLAVVGVLVTLWNLSILFAIFF